MSYQIAFSFDRETLRKIGRGFYHAVYPALIIFLVSVAGSLVDTVAGIDFGNAFLNGALVYLAQNSYNLFKEWAKGQ